MDKFTLNKDDVVLVVIDLQEKLMKAMKDREKVYKNTNLLLTTAYELGIPVVVTEQYPRGLGETVAEIKSSLKGFEYIEKVTFTACGQQLIDYLKRSGRKTIIMTGSETHVCVFQTVRDLVKSGYNVHVVKDAVCSRFDENYENGLALMKDVGAIITNAETVVFDLLHAAGTPAFKAISPLLK